MVTLFTSDLPPGAPRTETRTYGTGRGTAAIPPMPDIDDATPRELHDSMMQLASDCLRHNAVLRTTCRSEAHVRELCRAIERLDVRDTSLCDQLSALEAKVAMLAQQLVTEANLGAEYLRQFLASQDRLQETALELEAERDRSENAECLSMSAMITISRISAEGRQLKLNYMDLQARVDAESRSRSRVVMASRVLESYGQWDTSDVEDDKTVVDVGVML